MILSIRTSFIWFQEPGPLGQVRDSWLCLENNVTPCNQQSAISRQQSAKKKKFFGSAAIQNII
jgi:hypothetical protein